MSGHATRRRKAIDDDNGEYPLDEIDQAEIVRKLELSNARSNLLFSVPFCSFVRLDISFLVFFLSKKKKNSTLHWNALATT
jgi:hypothetical protein